MTPEFPETLYLVFIESIYWLWMALGDELDDNPVDLMHQFVLDVTGYFYGVRMWLGLQQKKTERKILIHSSQKDSSHAINSTFSCMASSGFFSN